MFPIILLGLAYWKREWVLRQLHLATGHLIEEQEESREEE